MIDWFAYSTFLYSGSDDETIRCFCSCFFSLVVEVQKKKVVSTMVHLCVLVQHHPEVHMHI